MSGTETLTRVPTNYSDVAALRGQTVLLYQQFGSYQGEWLCFARDKTKYYIYKGWYGSCSGCDDIQARWDYGNETLSQKELDEWLAEYPAFVDMPRLTAKNLAMAGRLMQTFPRNIREDLSSEVGLDEFVTECELVTKIEEDAGITNDDILAARSQEVRRRAIERKGIVRFMTEVAAIEMEKDDRGDRLMDVSGNKYLWLQDGSTDREYVLRVPDDTMRVREGKAWSFNISEDDYSPLIET